MANTMITGGMSVSSMAAITVPLRGTFTGGDHAFDTRYRSAQIDVGNN